MPSHETNFPRVVISALRGGSGKTVVSIGVIAALKARGNSVAPFKKGPDYIDAGWLALAAGRPCYNLDSFLLSAEAIRRSFCLHSPSAGSAVIEGNRGLYDGIDLDGATSTAELAKLLHAPVVLCLDCTKTTRTMAAVVCGCLGFDPEVAIRGVVLNRVAGARHESILRRSIEHYSGVPVIGAVPKLGREIFPERHMGLVPAPEHSWAVDSIDAIAQVASRHIDLEAFTRIARSAPPIGPLCESTQSENRMEAKPPARLPAVRIGIMRDSAFQFYYPENIEALSEAGAETVVVSPLMNDHLPEIDALYIGGGFPETHAAELAANTAFSRRLKELAEEGLPVYAECGGLMYLGEALEVEGRRHAMAGVLPVAFALFKRPQGHGYTVLSVEGENPYYPAGTEIRGHEFHYSRVVRWGGHDRDLVFRMQRGVGIHADRDGILYKNVLATYTHIHALGTPDWATSLVRNAAAYRSRKKRD
ncbi:MAG: cobyrinate a,c-diamide synthase [Desulfobacterales bacterium]